MRAENRAGVITVAALFAGALALSPVATQPVHAHGAVPHAAAPAAAKADTPAKTDTPAPARKRNRWGANYFPNVPLVTQDGKTVRLYDDVLKGKSVAINVVFTDCKDVCPLETAMMVKLQNVMGERFGKDIFFYSVSIDPERDTPQVLKAFAEKYGAKWTFLTGKPEDILQVTRKLGLLRGADLETRDGHSSILVVGDEPTGQWTRNSALDNPEFLAARIGGFLGWRDKTPAKTYAEARPWQPKDGGYLFHSRCSACHTIGEGDRIGPDLHGVTTRRERGWLLRYVRVPDQVLAEGDPIATALFKKYNQVRMPNIGLTADETFAIMSYVHEQTAARDKAAQHAGHGKAH